MKIIIFFQIGEGGEVPQEYYLSTSSIEDLSKFTTKTIARRSSLELDYEVKIEGTILR